MRVGLGAMWVGLGAMWGGSWVNVCRIWIKEHSKSAIEGRSWFDPYVAQYHWFSSSGPVWCSLPNRPFLCEDLKMQVKSDNRNQD